MNKKNINNVLSIINSTNQKDINNDCSELIRSLFKEINININDHEIVDIIKNKDSFNISFSNNVKLSFSLLNSQVRYDFRYFTNEYLIYFEMPLTVKQTRNLFNNGVFHEKYLRIRQKELLDNMSSSDLNDLLLSLSKETKRDLIYSGIPFNNEIPILLNGRLKNALGRCHYKRNCWTDQFETVKIDLCTRYFKKCTKKEFKNVLAHELIHSCDACIDCGHLGMWKVYANQLNAKNSNYHISRTTRVVFNY